MLKCLLVLWLAGGFWPVQALQLPPVQLSPAMGLHESASLSGHLAVLRDPGGQWGVQEVAAPLQAGGFAALPNFLAAGYTADAYWLRFSLQRTADAPAAWFLEVAPSYLDELTLFVPRPQGGFEVMRMGDTLPFAQRTLPHRSFVFALQLPAAQPQTLYLRVKTTSAMLARMQVWQHAGLMAAAQVDTALYGLFFGVVLLGFLSNLAFWFWLRERLYLQYCAYLALLAVAMLSASGFAAQWLLAQQPLLADRLVGVSTCLVYLLGTSFFVGVLRLRAHFVRIHRVFDVAMLVYALFAVVAIFGFYAVVAPWLMRVVFVMTTGITVACFWLLWHGHREYLFYILAFAANFASIPLRVAHLMGWISTDLSTDYAVLLGASMHIVLLNFAVANRMRLTEQKLRVSVKQTAELMAEREAAQQQRQFVAMVSHEFRTPLAVIDATAQSVALVCLRGASVESDQVAPRQEKIRRAVRRLVSLLDNFLISERLSFRAGQGAAEVLDLRDLARDAARNWTYLLQSPEQLRLDLGAVAVPVLAERAMLLLALSNLIDNALKYAPPGQPLTLRTGKTADEGWMEVEDGGMGIAAHEMGQIFDKFYRGGSAQGVPGAGLGLHLVRSIMQSHGGTVEVESQPGQGACFRLRLALVKG